MHEHTTPLAQMFVSATLETLVKP